jgi:hypothetical protein
MKYLETFNKLHESEDERPVVSYDFDGVCHTSVVGFDPINFTEFETWEPFTKMIAIMRAEAKDNKIVVVTARPPICEEYVWDFIKLHDLPVEEIYCTDNEDKVPVLVRIGAIKHYDDNPKFKEGLRKAGIEFVLVNPRTGEMKVNESAPNMILHGGILLIKGSDNGDGTQNLYAAPVKNVILVSPGAKMAILADTFYRIYWDGTKLRNKLISWKNDGHLAKILRMRGQSASIVLNDQKTPRHWLSLQYDNVAQMLYKIGTEIHAIEGIKWQE